MRISHINRLIVIISTAVAVATASGYLITRHDALAPLVVPLAVTAWVVFAIHHGYLVIRQLRWRHRRQVEADRLQQVAIPDDVPRPDTFPGVDVIDAAQHATLPTVPDYQAAMYARGVTVAAMPSLAVLIAAIQTTAVGSNLATGLSIANIAVMTTLIALVWLSRNPSQPWVKARTRAELLRREQYLCLAAVGPYQNLEPQHIADVAANRTTTITAATDETLHHLIPMRADAAHTPWHDQLWTQPNPPLHALRQRTLAYLHFRIGKQIMWFKLSEKLNRNAERRIATVIKSSLLAAVAATLLQTALHIANAAHPAPVTAAAGILTLVLPPTCAFLLAIQELFSHRRLATSYSHMLERLVDERTALTNLVTTLDNEANIDRATPSQQFQTTVLRTESNLTEELQWWRMLTQRDEYDLSL